MTWGELQVEVQRLCDLHRTNIHPEVAEKLKSRINIGIKAIKPEFLQEHLNRVIDDMTEKGE
jgi:hypothetical protein